MFAIGGSIRDPKLKYFKQIKVRTVEYRYDADNVIVCQLSQPYNFLGFQFLDFGCEADHLRQEVEADAGRAKYEQACELRQRGMTLDQIAAKLGYSNKGGVSKLLKRFDEVSQVSTGNQPETESDI